MVVRKGELVKFIDLLTKDGETSVVVDYCITYIKYCVVPLRKEVAVVRVLTWIEPSMSHNTEDFSPQITCTLEKLVYKDKQVSSDIKGYENKEYLLGWWNW